jgi:transglutaminase-like putative cysteine protease
MGRELVTGFSEDVSLQEVGLLRQSARVAFRVQFFRNDQTDKPVQAPSPLLMRGTSLPLYRHGQWFGYAQALVGPMTIEADTRDLVRDSYFASEDVYALRGADVPAELVLQKVKLTEAPGRVLFALYRPMVLDAGGSSALGRGGTSHNVVNLSGQLEGNAYEAVSMVPHFAPELLQKAGTPRPSPPWLAFWDVPAPLQPVLTRLRGEIEALYHPTNDYDRVVAAEKYLVSSGRFTYTLDLAEYGAEDPIAAFLTKTRRGCCEHFASALALIVRTWSIPTRLVVGYKDGAYDADDRSYVFRDQDAHAWVEVYFNNLGWVQFDPSPDMGGPPLQPGASLAGGPGVFARLSQAVSGLLTYVNTRWNTHVIGYTRDEQRAVVQGLTEAARGLTADASSLLRVFWPGLPDLGFLQVALVVVGITFAGLFLYLLAGWLDRAVRRRRRARPGRTLRFYEELLAIMRSKGLRRPMHQTPREFARVVAAQFGPQDGSVTQAVDLVTDLYYRARFGGYELSAEEQSRMRDALRKLKAIPRLRRTPGQSAAPA